MVDAEARLIAQRPHDDAGVVLVALHHARGPLDVCRLPGGIRAQSIQVACGFHAVALKIRLVDDVQPVAVAEIVEARIVGIVGGADRVP